MVSGSNGAHNGIGNGGIGEHGAGGMDAEGAAKAAGAWDRMSALLPFVMTVMADRSRQGSARAAFRLQMLFWVLSVVIDQLEATRGVMERARDRLKDVDSRLNQGADSGDGAEW